MTPKSQISLILLALCFSRATLGMDTESVLHSADLNPGKEANAELESAGSSLTRHVANSDKQEYGDNYIATILDPRERMGLARDQVEYPDSKQGKKALMSMLSEDHKSLKSDLQRLVTTTQRQIHIRRRTTSVAKGMELEELEALMKIISRIDSIQTQLWTPMRNRLSQTVGKHLTFIGTHNAGNFEKPREYKGIDDQPIEPMPKKIEAEHETQMGTFRELNAKAIPKQTLLHGDPFQLVMNRLTKDSVEELVHCLDHFHTKSFQSIHVDIRRMVYLTVYHMYKHEFINLEAFRSFFRLLGVTKIYVKNLFQHFGPQLKNEWSSVDRDIIVRSCDSQVDRSIFEALDPDTQRIVSLDSIQVAFESYRDHPSSTKQFITYCSAYLRFLRYDQIYIGLEDWDLKTLMASSELEQKFEKVISDFNNINQFEPSSRKRQNTRLLLLFQYMQFLQKNYQQGHGIQIFPTDSSFTKKYSLVSESMEFIRELVKIKICLHKYFPQSHYNKLKIHGVHNRKKVLSPLQELKLISKHISKIDLTHQKAIKKILDGDPLNAYCQHQYTRYMVQSLKRKLILLRAKHFILQKPIQ
ncbi:hypothetical protein PSTG_03946 [Puccinia striiformis f. sp. tritici PST-78]|uniref:Uncharacterized protein n=1 Tax=Puccinia striiformis f. sp. tritici PST-78 TaxID=1165861 RepID=A0A0L0VUY6_9BASI|nr:hypothetical protein PSTG_03946 [Puccinia striiformis f. sp. tritici PST-78]